MKFPKNILWKLKTFNLLSDKSLGGIKLVEILFEASTENVENMPRI